MNSIKATWTNGQIVPTEPVDWPEGCALKVEPVHANGAKIGMTEEEWKDDPESIAAWIEAVDKIEPLEWLEGEEEEYQRHREKMRQFNIDAVRKQFEEMDRGESP